MATELEQILESELVLLTRLGGQQSRIKEAVYHKNWLDFDPLMADLARTSRELKDKEDERRYMLPSALVGGNFYAAAINRLSAYTAEQRRHITELYRALKMTLLKIRLDSEALQHYLKESLDFAHDAMEAAFPQTRGKIYSRTGIVAPAQELSGVFIEEAV
jgi:hypothetical protein